MARSKWYVVQTNTGQEQRMVQAIERICAEKQREEEARAEGYADRILDECFSPAFRTQRKRMGEWRTVEYPLLPGYVIAVTSDPARLQRILDSLEEYPHLLTMGETYVPLSDAERYWLEECTVKGSRVIPMSFAHKEGERLVVSQGPLKGREGLITRVQRKKSMASIELHVGQIKITTKVGLGIVPGETAGR